MQIEEPNMENNDSDKKIDETPAQIEEKLPTTMLELMESSQESQKIKNTFTLIRENFTPLKSKKQEEIGTAASGLKIKSSGKKPRKKQNKEVDETLLFAEVPLKKVNQFNAIFEIKFIQRFASYCGISRQRRTVQPLLRRTSLIFTR